MTIAKKITKTHFKSLLKKNASLYISTKGGFDGMTDGFEYSSDNSFKPLQKTERFFANTLGFEGVWLVTSSGNYFTPYDDGQYSGIEVQNCCRSFIVATKSI